MAAAHIFGEVYWKLRFCKHCQVPSAALRERRLTWKQKYLEFHVQQVQLPDNLLLSHTQCLEVLEVDTGVRYWERSRRAEQVGALSGLHGLVGACQDDICVIKV